MQKFLDNFPGIILAVFIGILAKQLSNFLYNIGSVTTAIIIGILVGNLFKPGKGFTTGIRFAEKKILALAIMLLGVQLNLQIIGSFGVKTVIYIMLLIALSIGCCVLIGNKIGLSKSLSLLIGIGNGICGSSAIAAAVPILAVEEDETGLSISVINLLGTIGIFLLPLVHLFLKFDGISGGLLIGGTLQAVGQVTAAGFSVNDHVGNLATIIKLGRVLMLGPFLVILSLFNKNKVVEKKKRIRLPIPGFVLGFLLFSLIASLQLLPIVWFNTLKRLSKEFLIIAMAAVGLKIRFAALFNQGPKALLVGSLGFVIQILVAILLVLILF